MKCTTCGNENPTRRIGLTFYCDTCAPKHVQTWPIGEAFMGAVKQALAQASGVQVPQTSGVPPEPCRMVLFSLTNGPSKGQQRPAVVVRRVADRPDLDSPIVLHVWTDANLDGVQDHTTGATYSATSIPGTWSWPARKPYAAPRLSELTFKGCEEAP